MTLNSDSPDFTPATPEPFRSPVLRIKSMACVSTCWTPETLLLLVILQLVVFITELYVLHVFGIKFLLKYMMYKYFSLCVCVCAWYVCVCEHVWYVHV